MWIAILIGALSGVVAALCGVGGGIVMVPLFTMFLGLSQKQAVATSLAAIVLTALFASLKNSANHFVDWKIAGVAGVAGNYAALKYLIGSPTSTLANLLVGTLFVGPLTAISQAGRLKFH